MRSQVVKPWLVALILFPTAVLLLFGAIHGRRDTYVVHVPLLSSRIYESSEYEELWLKNILDFCSYSNKIHSHTVQMLAAVKYRQALSTGKGSHGDGTDQLKYLSTIRMRRSSNTSEITYIEPIQGMMRHPFAWDCQADTPSSMLMDTSYIILAANVPKQVRKFYFDIGSSSYADLSQSWMLKAYEDNGIKFDRILLWEAGDLDAKAHFKSIPAELLHAYQFFNLPAEPGVNNWRNPLSILKHITAPDDFVSLKLDIDSSVIEQKLVDQILSDLDLYTRIDEFFWEHHYNNTQLIRCCWGSSADVKASQAYSYSMFLNLRKLGIRAHGWP